ncbi:transposase-like protein [Azospirillum canadense]|nr:transposase-like protein [Azospirillum canadense]
MTMRPDAMYAGYRFPAEVISDAVHLYYRFPLGLRMVEEMLARRGIVVSHETIRAGGLTFGRRSPTASASVVWLTVPNGTWTRS